MITQNPYASVQVGGQQELVLMRQDLQPCALGKVGNLSYAAWQGGTTPARSGGILLSDLRRSWADERVDATSRAIADPLKEQAKLEAFEVRVNSGRIGDLLGSLTAGVDRTYPTIRAMDYDKIAQALTNLKLAPESGLYSLKGAAYCLDTYLDELKEFDLVALRRGVLNNEKSRRNVLNRISTHAQDELRIQASRVLDDVAAAVNQRLARHAMHEPLWRIVDLLTADPVNGQDLCVQLLAIPDDEVTLGRYFRMLTADEFKALLDVLQFNQLSAAEGALSQIADDVRVQSLSKLEAIYAASEREFLERTENVLAHLREHLELCLALSSGPAVSAALHCLSLAVNGACQTYGPLPYPMSTSMRKLVAENMDLFRDHQSNPTGPLSWLSLSKLDDDIRKNLFDAALVLWTFGLELDPALRAS